MIRDAIMAVIQAISASRLKVLWLEDWHWADVASDECLRELFRVMARFRILVIVTIRPRTGVAWPIKDNMTAVTLRPLDRKGTGAMVSALLSNAIVPEPLVNLLYERTEGNALFMTELLHSLKQHASIDYAYRRAVEYAERAKKPLYAFPPSSERDALLALPDYVLSRDR